MLADSLKTLLATEYAFVIKAQLFHWNVEGPDFAQLHEFFGNIYEEVYENSIAFFAFRERESIGPGSGKTSNVSKPYKLRPNFPARYASTLKLFPTPKPHSKILALLFVAPDLDIN